MRDPLLIKGMADLRGQVIGWGIGMAAMIFLTVLLYPSISDAYADMIDELPSGFSAFFGADVSLDQIEGYLNVELFSYLPVVIAIFAVMAGSAAISGEENQGTLDLLLAQPLSRLRAATAKLAALALSLALVVVVMAAGVWAGLAFIDEPAADLRILNALLLLIPFEVTIALAAALASQILGSRLMAGTAIAVVVAISYVLDALANLNSMLETLRPLYVTAYYQGEEALTGQVSAGYTTALLLAMMALAVAAVVVCSCGAISAPTPWSACRGSVVGKQATAWCTRAELAQKAALQRCPHFSLNITSTAGFRTLPPR
jgi:ABC-2 type transport system permease protein